MTRELFWPRPLGTWAIPPAGQAVSMLPFASIRWIWIPAVLFMPLSLPAAMKAPPLPSLARWGRVAAV